MPDPVFGDLLEDHNNFYISSSSNATIKFYTPPADALIINDSGGKPIVTVHFDHTVTMHQPEKANEAAKKFWQLIQDYGAAHCVMHKEG